MRSEAVDNYLDNLLPDARCLSGDDGGSALLRQDLDDGTERPRHPVNTPTLGATDTPIIDSQPRIKAEGAAARKAYGVAALMGRIGQPEVLAAAALILASDDSSFVTGIDSPVVGGLAQV